MKRSKSSTLQMDDITSLSGNCATIVATCFYIVKCSNVLTRALTLLRKLMVFQDIWLLEGKEIEVEEFLWKNIEKMKNQKH